MLFVVDTGTNLNASTRIPTRDAGQYIAPPPALTPCDENSLLLKAMYPTVANTSCFTVDRVRR